MRTDANGAYMMYDPPGEDPRYSSQYLPTLEAIKTQIEPEVFDAWQAIEIDIHQRREAKRTGSVAQKVTNGLPRK